MMRALNAQLLKSFPILKECLPMRLPNPTYFQVSMEPGRIEKSHAFVAFFKKKWKAFNLTCFSSTPFDFILTQTMWNSLNEYEDLLRKSIEY
jgi:hypothetical protein